MLNKNEKKYLIESILNEVSGRDFYKILKRMTRELESKGMEVIRPDGTPLSKIINNFNQTGRVSQKIGEIKGNNPSATLEDIYDSLPNDNPMFKSYKEMLFNKLYSRIDPTAINSDVPHEYKAIKKMRAAMSPKDVEMEIFANARKKR